MDSMLEIEEKTEKTEAELAEIRDAQWAAIAELRAPFEGDGGVA